MSEREEINLYDFIKVVRVPVEHEGVIDVGDIGIVIEKYNSETFEVECITPDGSYKWLETLTTREISRYLRSSSGMRESLEKRMMQRSIKLGVVVGASTGMIFGAGLGAITGTINSVLLGSGVGFITGSITGAITGALTARTAGTTGGVGVGYFTGMLFGGAFGMVLGMLIPTSVRMRANTEGLPVLDALAHSRFETAILFSFVLSVLATIVGIVIGGRNYVPRTIKDGK